MPDTSVVRSAADALRVAIVGSGPSGFYAAEELLLSAAGVEVTMLERLPAPFGLVRSGVAPDHPKLKQPMAVFDRIARSSSFRYFGNVELGRDVSLAELGRHFDAVVLACGSQSERRLGIPGEDLPGSHAGTDFVGWYNGHPDHAHHRFDLSQEAVCIVGQGNVALDIARMLAKSVDELRHTDIAQHALDALAASRVRDIHIVGRRGPAQAKFTPPELMEFGRIPGCDIAVSEGDLVLNEASAAEAADRMRRNIASNLSLLNKFAAGTRTANRRCCHFHFLLSPLRIEGDGRVERLQLERTRLDGPPFRQTARGTGETVTLECGVVFRSIGYKVMPVPDVPYDDVRARVPNQAGRVVCAADAPLPRLYVTGWMKRGPSGIIGTNKADSMETVATLLADLATAPRGSRPGADGLALDLERRRHAYVDYADWQRIDEHEVARGAPAGKPREKLLTPVSMLQVVGKSYG
jgi:ferredoxin--NADP+ reductase